MIRAIVLTAIAAAVAGLFIAIGAEVIQAGQPITWREQRIRACMTEGEHTRLGCERKFDGFESFRPGSLDAEQLRNKEVFGRPL